MVEVEPSPTFCYIFLSHISTTILFELKKMGNYFLRLCLFSSSPDLGPVFISPIKLQSGFLVELLISFPICSTWYKALYWLVQSWGTLYCFALHDKKLFFYLHKAEVQYLLQDIEALLHNMHNKQTQRNACVQFIIAYVRCTFLQGTEAWLHKGKLNTNEETEHRWR